MLKLNDDKTELITFGSSYFTRKVPSITLKLSDSEIVSSAHVTNLGASFDMNMSMEKFVSQKVKSCMYYLRNIYRIRRFLTPEATKTLVHAYIMSRLDYSNSLLYGINKCQINRLQTFQNAADRLIFQASKRDSVTPLPLHCLPIENT